MSRGRHLNAALDISTNRLEPVLPATGSYVLAGLSYYCLAVCVVVLNVPGLGNPRPGHTTKKVMGLQEDI
jgi:hypothetical protein